MKLFSTNNPKKEYSLKEAVFQGLPEDNGLFMPRHIPVMEEGFFKELPSLSFQQIAYRVSGRLLGSSVNDDDLKTLVEEAFNFEIPLVPIEPGIHALELFHGPTFAFKDFGARFMARLMKYYLQDQKLCILVATSGDTGSAVAQGFFQVPGIEVVILYPSDKVSKIQEQQLTTVGHNVKALEIKGTFDDCQHLVKQAFLDKELRQECGLSSANSINIARLIPQSFYYFWMFARLCHLQQPVFCSVPSGNFGNLMGGLIAKRMGLPIDMFIAANNDNRVFYDYIQSGTFAAKQSLSTISNAMDVGNPSNFVRIMSLFEENLAALKTQVSADTYSDELTKKAITDVYRKYDYLLDPHGAVGYLALKKYLKRHQGVGAFLATAHPAKFYDSVQPLIDKPIELPNSLKATLDKPKKARVMDASFDSLKGYLKAEFRP